MSSKELPPFSGDKPTCLKCGNVGATTSFMAYGECKHSNGQPTGMVFGYFHNERLHRSCLRCDYAWDEATVAQKPPARAEQITRGGA